MNTAGDVNDANKNYKIINMQDHNFQENVDISLLNCKFFVSLTILLFPVKIFYIRIYKHI